MMSGNLRVSVLFVVFVLFAMMVSDVSYAGLSLDKVLGIWLFDEGKGTIAKDSSGNGNDAEEAMKGPLWAKGKFGQGLKFEQKGWYDCDNPVMTETVDFTMGVWCLPADKQKTWTNILSTHQEPPRRGISFEQTENNVNTIGLALGNGADWAAHPDFKVKMTTDKWNHIAVVRDGGTGYYYKNGEVVSEQPFKGPKKPVALPTSNFRIGNWVLGGREWNGVVDEAFLFERALSKDEIQSIFKLGLEGAQPVSPKDRAATCWGKLKSWRKD